jgi:hypothetical protein
MFHFQLKDFFSTVSSEHVNWVHNTVSKSREKNMAPSCQYHRVVSSDSRGPLRR